MSSRNVIFSRKVGQTVHKIPRRIQFAGTQKGNENIAGSQSSSKLKASNLGYTFSLLSFFAALKMSLQPESHSEKIAMTYGLM